MRGSWPSPTPLGVLGTSQEVKSQHRLLLWGTAGSGGLALPLRLQPSEQLTHRIIWFL